MPPSPDLVVRNVLQKFLLRFHAGSAPFEGVLAGAVPVHIFYDIDAAEVVIFAEQGEGRLNRTADIGGAVKQVEYLAHDVVVELICRRGRVEPMPYGLRQLRALFEFLDVVGLTDDAVDTPVRVFHARVTHPEPAHSLPPQVGAEFDLPVQMRKPPLPDHTTQVRGARGM